MNLILVRPKTLNKHDFNFLEYELWKPLQMF